MIMIEFIGVLKSLKIPTMNPDELAAFRQLEQEWQHWRERELGIMPLRIEPEQKAAYAAFLDDPSEANEQRLAVLADPLLTGKRYALLRRAFIELRCRITAQAAAILRQTLGRIKEALNAEHDRRLEIAEPSPGSKQLYPSVKECRTAYEYAHSMHSRVYTAYNGHSNETPFQLAGGLAKSEL